MKTQLVLCLGMAVLFSACERTEFKIPSIKLHSRVLLMGAVTDGSVMRVALNLEKRLPNDQPYLVEPFAYDGDEFVPDFPENIVDWVLVALHDMESKKIISERAALLTNEGSIVDTDGMSPVAFNMVQGSYVVSVRHRNHLGIISDQAVDFSHGEGECDFTIGNSGEIKIGEKVWAMVPGDVNADAMVNNTDLVLLSTSTAIGYFSEYSDFDINLDGLINNTDLVILAPYAAVGYLGSL